MNDEQWEMTEGTCDTDGAEGIPTYGVTVHHTDGSVWSWPDVDTDPAVVQTLLMRLRQVRPERCHYADVVLDFIEEVARGSF